MPRCLIRRCQRFTANRLIGALLAVLAILVLGDPDSAFAAPGASPGFTPHRAVYKMSLGESRNNGAIAAAEGKLEFEWADVCSGWSVNQRSHVRMVSSEGQAFEFGWTLSALETKDGENYRFFLRSFGADGSVEESRGKARLHGPDQGGVASLQAPEEKEVPLPKGAMFPTAHSLLLMQAAAQGEASLWRVIFDGSGEDDGRSGVSAAISPALPADMPLQFDSPILRGQKSWRVHLAYFSTDETVSEPQHEQRLRLFANGIVDEMQLDYKDFVLKADLTVLEALPEVACKVE